MAPVMAMEPQPVAGPALMPCITSRPNSTKTPATSFITGLVGLVSLSGDMTADTTLAMRRPESAPTGYHVSI